MRLGNWKSNTWNISLSMSTQDARILPLGPDVVAKLKSSTSIIHLNGVIVELVKNALDADAHSIAVTVDFQRGGCVVEDDGEGISPSEFEVNGGLGKAHRTFMPQSAFRTVLLISEQIRPSSARIKRFMGEGACFWHHWRPCHCSPLRPVVCAIRAPTRSYSTIQHQ